MKIVSIDHIENSTEFLHRPFGFLCRATLICIIRYLLRLIDRGLASLAGFLCRTTLICIIRYLLKLICRGLTFLLFLGRGGCSLVLHEFPTFILLLAESDNLLEC